MTNKIATTVKVAPILYDEFKLLGIRHKLTLQGLVEKTVFRYVNDEIFRNDINNFILPVTATFITSVTSSISTQ
jgi:hypothetical protein